MGSNPVEGTDNIVMKISFIKLGTNAFFVSVGIALYGLVHSELLISTMGIVTLWMFLGLTYLIERYEQD